MVVGVAQEGAREELSGKYRDEGCRDEPYLLIEEFLAYEIDGYCNKGSDNRGEIGTYGLYDSCGWRACSEKPCEETEEQVKEGEEVYFLPVREVSIRVEANTVWKVLH